jgi:hypothetical protein
MIFLQAIPESGQLFVLGAGLVLMGVLIRKLRKGLLALRNATSSLPPARGKAELV